MQAYFSAAAAIVLFTCSCDFMLDAAGGTVACPEVSVRLLFHARFRRRLCPTPCNANHHSRAQPCGCRPRIFNLAAGSDYHARHGRAVVCPVDSWHVRYVVLLHAFRAIAVRPRRRRKHRQPERLVGLRIPHLARACTRVRET